MPVRILPFLLVMLVCAPLVADEPKSPVPLIFDTDIGNDVDDVLALAMIHSLESRGECDLLGVTITKDSPAAAAFTDAVNTFYGRGDIPIGVCRSDVTPEAGKFLELANQKDNGQLRYPHDLASGKAAPDAVDLLRKILAAAEDQSVVIAQVGFSTNLANLLASPGDQHSPLSGKELVQQKVKLLSVMGGAFTQIPDHKGRYGEYNIIKDLPASRTLAEKWPTPIIWSGYEIGIALPYPHESIENDYGYVPHHPVSEAYYLYSPPPHDRPTWDLTSVLFAVRPDAGDFQLSEPGKVAINEEGHTIFTPQTGGRDRYLILPAGGKKRVIDTLIELSKRPPDASETE
ncbi:nucleoside hydrolase [Blastopirellula marina]|uniref:Nucleoside hydrolase n=1 Tax=Blastopirellula marina TaxID=124 RepID=A0A2S8GJI2_9BACT|nr:nucleoside hydrolase [Blastopirellula marina]